MADGEEILAGLLSITLDGIAEKTRESLLNANA